MNIIIGTRFQIKEHGRRTIPGREVHSNELERALEAAASAHGVLAACDLAKYVESLEIGFDEDVDGYGVSVKVVILVRGVLGSRTSVRRSAGRSFQLPNLFNNVRIESYAIRHTFFAVREIKKDFPALASYIEYKTPDEMWLRDFEETSVAA